MTDFSGKGNRTGRHVGYRPCHHLLRDAQVTVGGRRECSIDGVECAGRRARPRRLGGCSAHRGFNPGQCRYRRAAASAVSGHGPRRFSEFLRQVWGYAKRSSGRAAQFAMAVVVLYSGYPALVTVARAHSRHRHRRRLVEAFIRLAATKPRRRINGVCPGLIDTPMSPLEGEQREAYYRDGTAGHLIPRAGTAEECASAAMFLLANELAGTIVESTAATHMSSTGLPASRGDTPGRSTERLIFASVLKRGEKSLPAGRAGRDEPGYSDSAPPAAIAARGRCRGRTRRDVRAVPDGESAGMGDIDSGSTRAFNRASGVNHNRGGRFCTTLRRRYRPPPRPGCERQYCAGAQRAREWADGLPQVTFSINGNASFRKPA